jgi:hypothetical protein
MCQDCCIGHRALSPNLHATTLSHFVDVTTKRLPAKLRTVIAEAVSIARNWPTN